MAQDDIEDGHAEGLGTDERNELFGHALSRFAVAILRDAAEHFGGSLFAGLVTSIGNAFGLTKYGPVTGAAPQIVVQRRSTGLAVAS